MRRLIICLLILHILFLMVFCDSEKQNNEQEKITYSEQKTDENDNESIIIAATEWPPFEYTENKEKKGTDVDVVREVFNEMGLEGKFEIRLFYSPFSSLFQLCYKIYFNFGLLHLQ